MDVKRRGRGAIVRAVRVDATARLHLGFLDLNGDLGRRFGSIGLSIDAFSTRIELTAAKFFHVAGGDSARAGEIAARVAEKLGVDQAKALVAEQTIPAHAGLGSGTQLALAVAAAYRRFHDLPADPATDARLLHRGARSGAGAALFSNGGLVVDAGRGAETDLPPVVANAQFPEDWRVLLVLDPTLKGVHGVDERRAFEKLPTFPAASAADICRRTLMQVLPGVLERDLDAFGSGIVEIQAILGDHFAPEQGGGRFISAAVGRVAERLRALGARGLGQSSWGPTGFAFARDADEAEYLRRNVDDASSGLRILICKARNRGADVSATT